MRTLIVGDIHGGYKALLQCLQRSNFDKENDQLISLGDICDGWPEVKEVFDELLSIKNLIFIIGNHDYWTLEWMLSGHTPDIWTSQGGQNTLESYKSDTTKVPLAHKELLRNAHLVYVDEKNRLFVHGGINPNQKDLSKQDTQFLMWDRDLVYNALRKRNQKPNFKYGVWDEIYVGHTSTSYTTHTLVPEKLCNIWMMDTGGGFEGKLSIMDIDTKQYWQSDMVNDLYTGVHPR